MRARQTRRTQHIAYTPLALFCRVTFKPLRQISFVSDTRQFENSTSHQRQQREAPLKFPLRPALADEAMSYERLNTRTRQHNDRFCRRSCRRPESATLATLLRTTASISATTASTRHSPADWRVLLTAWRFLQSQVTAVRTASSFASLGRRVSSGLITSRASHPQLSDSPSIKQSGSTEQRRADGNHQFNRVVHGFRELRRRDGLSPQYRLGRINAADLIAQPVRSIIGKKQRPVQIDHTSALRHQHGWRHRQRSRHHTTDH
jgi:hypothetical protein